ncbi:MAG: EAL domain-containing protein [Bryobacterales bacterium]|nr:EAL domain-containing protein [Bryobacterales bacterium]
MEALRALIRNIPVAANYAYIVAQHLAPQHKSMLTELLRRETVLPVTEVVSELELQQGHIYITPPNADVVVSNRTLRLQPPAGHGPKPSIDALLFSLAQDTGPSSIAVILSGSGSDGAKGVRAIREAGGYVIAQTAENARYSSMPDAARSTGCVDVVLDAEQIGPHLGQLSSGGVPLRVPEIKAAPGTELGRILAVVLENANVDFRGYKTKTILRRVGQRMAALNIGGVSDYVHYIERVPEESAQLAQSCMISVTGFYRDYEAFEELAAILAERFASHPKGQAIRVWVPACATGEEAYTLAIVMTRLFPGHRLQIFGTDIDEAAIQTARRAYYAGSHLHDVPEALVSEYFRPGAGGYQLEKRVRDQVIFARHDILRDPLFMNLDLVSCRNFLIYLKNNLQDEALRRFHYALKPGGLLFLGRSEYARAPFFETLSRRNKIFENREHQGDRRHIPAETQVVRRDGAPQLRNQERDSGSAMQQALLRTYAPPGVLVDHAFRIIESHGDVGRILTLQMGRPDMTLFSLLPKQAAASLRAQLYRARRTAHTIRGVPRPVEISGRTIWLQTIVTPIETHAEPLYLVGFIEHAPPQGEQALAIARGEDHQQQLEHELSSARENLQSTVEELETSTEELQSLNQELQSANEELQASNEELQASNEELHSANEELVTVNEELEHKSQELSLLLTDFENIQNSIESPVLVVTPQVVIRHLNSAAIQELGLSADSIGSPLVIPDEPAASTALAARIQRVVLEKTTIELNTRLLKKDFLVHIRPYISNDGEISGVVVSFLNVTSLLGLSRRLKSSQSKLRLLAQRQRMVIDSVPSEIAVLDATGKVVAVNSAWRRFATHNGFRERKHGVGTNYVDICRRATGPESDGAAEVANGLERVLSGEAKSFHYDYSCHTPEGRRWFRALITAAGDSKRGGAVVVHLDITNEVEMSRTMSRQTSALQSAANAIFITDAEGQIDWVNEACLRLSGYLAEDLLGLTPEMIEAPHNPHAFHDLLRECKKLGRPWSGEIVNRTKSGQTYTVRQTITPIASSGGELTHFVVVQEDITSHKQAQAQVMYMAEHDDLTGLWNRKTFQDRLSQAIVRQQRKNGSIAVLFLDLDRFKDTNDTLGHLAGDQMLLEISRRVRHNLPDGAGLGRFGGDEFVIFLEGPADRDQVTFTVERLLRSFSQPIDISGRPMFISASIGATVFPQDGTNSEQLLRNADLAMYRAKSEGRRGYRFYDSTLEAEINLRVSIERDLNRALGTKEMWVAYQPQFDLRNGNLVGAEALLRWDRVSEHNITIGQVISVAEEAGLILPISHWVLKDALGSLHRWHAAGRPIRLSVNLSAVQFHQQDVFGILTESTRARGLPTWAVKAEITESVLLHSSVRVREILHALHGAGFGLVLDDFGTGYSSLTYLQQFPIETVKIDASFLRGIGRDRNDETIVTGIIRMAHALGQSVVAEGVETQEQLEFLKHQDCDFGQGFLLARPMPAAEFEELLANSATPPPPPVNNGERPRSRSAAV